MESSVQRRVEAISRHLLSLPREPNFFLHQVKIISFTVFIFIFYNDLLYGAIYSHSHVVYLLTQLCFLMGFFLKVLLNGGKVKNGDAEAVIIGGMVLDIHAIPSVPANPRTTTPGKVFFCYFHIYIWLFKV